MKTTSKTSSMTVDPMAVLDKYALKPPPLGYATGPQIAVRLGMNRKYASVFVSALAKRHPVKTAMAMSGCTKCLWYCVADIAAALEAER